MVKREVGNELSAAARRQGKPLFTLASDIVQAYLDISKRGYDLREMIESYDCLRLARDTGHTIIQKDLLEYLVNNTYPAKKDEMRTLWNAAGSVAVKYAEGLNKEPVKALRQFLKHVVWGVSKFAVEESDDAVTIRVYCPSFSDDLTELLSEFLEGYFSAAGFKSLKKEKIRGLIYMVFGRRPDSRLY